MHVFKQSIVKCAPVGETHWCPGSCWANRVGQDPSDSKSNWLVTCWHLLVLMLSFNWGILYRFPLEWSVSFLKSRTSIGYFLNSTGSSATNHRFFPDIGEAHMNQWSGRFLGMTGREILVFAIPTGYMLTSSGSPSLNQGIFFWIPLKWWANSLQSWTSTGYFSNSTGSSVTNCRFSSIIEIWTA